MNKETLMKMTVIELRKLAKESHITLGTGISKDLIIQKLMEGLELNETKPDQSQTTETPQVKPAATPNAAEPAEPVPVHPTTAPTFRAAWHNTAPIQKPQVRSSYAVSQDRAVPMQPSSAVSSQPIRRPDVSVNDGNRIQVPTPQTRTTHRFGPGAVTARQDVVTNVVPRPIVKPEPVRERTEYTQPHYQVPEQVTSVQRAEPPRVSVASVPKTQQEAAKEPVSQETIQSLIYPANCPETSGILEVHQEGHGLLRSESLLSSALDVVVPAQVIKRERLRTGDSIVAKMRPRKEGEKNAVVLYVTKVNGEEKGSNTDRKMISELTAVYPNKKIDLDIPELPEIQKLQTMMPMGFGQRAAIICPSDMKRQQMLLKMANHIGDTYPSADVVMLLVGMNPEDAAWYRENIHCRLIVTTFDQPSDVQLRMLDLFQESIHRQAETGRDVVVITDGISRIGRIGLSVPTQTPRVTLLNPTSLIRVKRLLGGARALKEGGSITVITAANPAENSKPDEAILEEFRYVFNWRCTLNEQQQVVWNMCSSENTDQLSMDKDKIRSRIDAATGGDNVM